MARVTTEYCIMREKEGHNLVTSRLHVWKVILSNKDMKGVFIQPFITRMFTNRAQLN